MEIRNVTEKEFHSAAWLHRYAFAGWSDEEKEDWVTWLKSEQTFGLFDHGKLVSSVVVHDFQQSVRGILKKMGGIAAVASYPEARYKGYIRELMKAIFKDMHSKGFSVSMLGAFKRSFYAKFGYVTANSDPIIRTPAQNLRSAVEKSIDPDWQFERVRAVDAKEEFLSFMAEIAPSRYHGFVLHPTVTDAVWKLINKNAIVVLVKRKGKVEAAARYRIKYVMKYEEADQELVVYEMYWRNLEAHAKLLNFFARHSDQMTHFSFHLPIGVSFEKWIEDADYEVRMWEKGDWMVRVIDVEKAIADLPVEDPGEITLEVNDPLCQWNNGTFNFKEKDGKILVGRSTGKPIGRLTIEGVTALVYGTHSLEEIEFKGWADIQDEEARYILQHWFPPLPIYNTLDF
ncbi:MAG: enhanced intracellular survival protein Eis [Promethearchaeota archaeon]